jgi:hypothetical protein
MAERPLLIASLFEESSTFPTRRNIDGRRDGDTIAAKAVRSRRMGSARKAKWLQGIYK